MQIQIGEEKRQIVSSIREYYQPDEMVGKTIVVVYNLKPAKIRGIESYGMLLAVADGKGGTGTFDHRQARAGWAEDKLMAALFDTHAHLLDDAFFKDRKALIKTLADSGIKGVIECATDEEESRKAIKLAAANGFVYAAVGIHPHNASKASAEYLKVLRELAREPKVAAIGEIGLDYHYDYSPRDVQKKVFEEQILLSLEINKPIVVHMREATEDTLVLLKKHAPLRGVMHCFSGSAETAAECLKMGLYVSFSGSVTFKNAVHVREAAKAVPLDKILAETDCPYMAPEPFRGKRNDPQKVQYVLEKLAQIKELSFEEMCAVNMENANKLFLEQEK